METVRRKLAELTADELTQVIGGAASLAPDPFVGRALGRESGRTYLADLDLPETCEESSEQTTLTM